MVIRKKFPSTQTTTSHLTPLNITVRVTLVAEHTRHRRFVILRSGQCLLCRVTSHPMFVDVVAGLPTGMDFRGSCPERLIVFLIRVGVAHLRPPCLQMHNISICPCPNPLPFWDSRGARLTRETSRCIEENCSAIIRNYCKVFWGNISFPYLRTVTQLPVGNTIRFYNPNIPVHLWMQE